MCEAKINNQERSKWNDISGASSAAKAYFTEWKRVEVHDGMFYRRWNKVVGQAVSAYNGSIHSRTGFTPNKLLFRREVYNNADLMMPTQQPVEPATTDDYVKCLEEEMRLAYDVARETIGNNMI